MRLVEDVDLVAPLRGLQHDALADLADVVDAPLRGRVHLDHVERRPRGDRHARLACPVGRRRRARGAVERLGQDAGHRRLARAARAGEQVGLAHLVALDRVAERSNDGFLADDFVEVQGTVLPVKGGHAP